MWTYSIAAASEGARAVERDEVMTDVHGHHVSVCGTGRPGPEGLAHRGLRCVVGDCEPRS